MQGGIAEFGSVFVDAVQGKEIPLVNTATVEQLAACRDAVRRLPGVFIDPGYEYSIRAYRFKGRFQVGLSEEEIRPVLTNPAFDQLSILSTGASTYIVQKGTDKGTGLTFVKRYLNQDKPVVAIGHSDQDVPMLEAADFAYATVNCSAAVREMAKRGRCHIVNKPCQTGLLAAVQHRLKASSPIMIDSSDNLMFGILRAADRRPF